MNIKKVYIGQKIALASSPKEQLGTIVGVKRHKVVEVKPKDASGIMSYGIKVLVEYK